MTVRGKNIAVGSQWAHYKKGYPTVVNSIEIERKAGWTHRFVYFVETLDDGTTRQRRKTLDEFCMDAIRRKETSQ